MLKLIPLIIIKTSFDVQRLDLFAICESCRVFFLHNLICCRNVCTIFFFFLNLASTTAVTMFYGSDEGKVGLNAILPSSGARRPPKTFRNELSRSLQTAFEEISANTWYGWTTSSFGYKIGMHHFSVALIWTELRPPE